MIQDKVMTIPVFKDFRLIFGNHPGGNPEMFSPKKSFRGNSEYIRQRFEMRPVKSLALPGSEGGFPRSSKRKGNFIGIPE